nr:hypothetical protein [Cytophagales bacterium]
MKNRFNIWHFFYGTLLVALSWSCGLTADEDVDDDTIPTTGFFLKAKIDGVLVEFKQEDLQLVSIGSAIPGVYEMGISAGSSAGDNIGFSEVITLIVKDDSPIGVKTYNYLRPFTETGFGLKGFTLGYIKATEGLGYVTDVDEEDSILEITELTANRIKGKFSGIIYEIVSGNSKNITDGEFILKVNNRD